MVTNVKLMITNVIPPQSSKRSRAKRIVLLQDTWVWHHPLRWLRRKTIHDADLESLCAIAATLETSTPFWECSEPNNHLRWLQFYTKGLLNTFQYS